MESPGVLIQSIQDAVNKNRFKLAPINDFTTDQVEIELKTAGYTDKLIKQLYATQCEQNISVNLCDRNTSPFFHRLMMSSGTLNI